MDYSIESMTLAANDVDRTVAFYAGVFGIKFEAHQLEGGTLHAGTFAGKEFAILPAKLAQVEAKQNRLQLDIFVSDLDELIRRVESHGGRTNGRLGEDDEVRAIGCWDPDDNFIVFKQRK